MGDSAMPDLASPQFSTLSPDMAGFAAAPTPGLFSPGPSPAPTDIGMGLPQAAQLAALPTGGAPGGGLPQAAALAAAPSDPGGLQPFGAETLPPGYSSAPGPSGPELPLGTQPGTGQPPGPSTWQNIVGGIKEYAPLAVDALKIGSGALGAYSGLTAAQQAAKNNQLLQQAQKLQQQNAAPAVGFAQSELGQAAAGQIPAAQQQVIANWTTQAKAQVHQMLANLGITDSTTLAQYDAYVDQQAAELTNQALQSEQGLGIEAIGAATGALGGGGAAGTATTQQQTLDAAIAQANKNIAALAGAGA